MSLCPRASNTLRKVSAARLNSLFSNPCFLHVQLIHNVNPERGIRMNFAQKLKVMKIRRAIAGPDKIRKRSECFDWTYDAELYAFGKRLQENVSDETLRCVFVHDSYIRVEAEKRQAMVGFQESPQLDLKSNFDLINRGKDIISEFVLRYLRVAFPFLPEEGKT